ncbi:molybdenum cofactor biosynthesis protein B [Methanocalculus alkaliphilus]|uniref:MogA/MoaB family molybdenum cofactor biosynthesis protein n=1 Tax=Methanocalculus alkaliphilus TaxID=768730 RepID=UPI00209C7055|nr:MogA/MoaB family molybdenum cofactor biosynthesis protein [Methanocalculus alkaliphilus]MCP1716279.1 molybdenum cofactor biosynthesis protein B [Methanocalculus alkaliphilus]
MSKEHRRKVEVRPAIITVSTTRTEAEDLSGETIKTLLNEAGLSPVFYRIVPDQDEAIQQTLFEAMSEGNCIIINGGTGLTPDDRTIEAVRPLLDKEMDGFGEIFRQYSTREVGTAVILSRATAGLISGCAVFCIPGSTKAVRLAVSEIILPEIGHILSHAQKK